MAAGIEVGSTPSATPLAILPQPTPSFPARLPFLALDRIIADRPGLVSDVVAHDSPLARVASDHLPIKAALTLPSPVSV